MIRNTTTELLGAMKWLTLSHWQRDSDMNKQFYRLPSNALETLQHKENLEILHFESFILQETDVNRGKYSVASLLISRTVLFFLVLNRNLELIIKKESNLLGKTTFT